MAILSFGISLGIFILACVGPLSIFPLNFGGVLYGVVLIAQLCILAIELKNTRSISRKKNIYVYYEALIALLVLLFVFAWIYARNANMDYAQRFAAGTHLLSFERDSTLARIYALIRYIPLLAIAIYWYVRHSQGIHLFLRSALLWIGVSVLLIVLALPSAIHLQGMGVFAWIAMVPLFFILRRCSYARGLWLLGVYAAFSTMAIHYWLGGFNLVSLQGADFIIVAYYLVFFIAGYFILRRNPHPLFWAMLWAIFSFYRHYGFSAFPWGLLTHSQYTNITFIQIAELTGIWGIEFVLFSVNAALVVVIERMLGITQNPIGQLSTPSGILDRMSKWQTWQPLIIPAVLVVVTYGYGIISLAKPSAPSDTVRVALVQNNTDPRKNDYLNTFNILKRETSATLAQSPDIVMWPETAFVPNIRRWSQEDPEQYPLANLVERFLDYQKLAQVYLLTGNDDYTRDLDAAGNEINRYNRNAAILFSDSGERLETYHKMRLVPFTEYFPYKRLFPNLYNFLLAFDVTFWEPGTEAVVFHHPDFSFGVMICFEDSFPDSARPFVLNGAQVLVNLGNDYWAEDPVEAQQHLATAIFRSIEHRRPLVRATTSGITSFVNERGEVWSSLEPYVSGRLVEDLPIARDPVTTAYTRWGNWFAYLLMFLVGGWTGYAFFKKRRAVKKK